MDALAGGRDVPGRVRSTGRQSWIIDLDVGRNLVTVEAERTQLGQDRELLAAERPRGDFSRQVILGDTLDTERISAAYDGGLLELRIPVGERAKPRKIQVEQPQQETRQRSAPDRRRACEPDRAGRCCRPLGIVPGPVGDEHLLRDGFDEIIRFGWSSQDQMNPCGTSRSPTVPVPDKPLVGRFQRRTFDSGRRSADAPGAAPSDAPPRRDRGSSTDGPHKMPVAVDRRQEVAVIDDDAREY